MDANVAYCTGPAQLVYLLSALEVAGIPPRRCALQPFQRLGADDNLSDIVSRLGRELGFTVERAPSRKRVNRAAS